MKHKFVKSFQVLLVRFLVYKCYLVNFYMIIHGSLRSRNKSDLYFRFPRINVNRAVENNLT